MSVEGSEEQRCVWMRMVSLETFQQFCGTWGVGPGMRLERKREVRSSRALVIHCAAVEWRWYLDGRKGCMSDDQVENHFSCLLRRISIKEVVGLFPQTEITSNVLEDINFLAVWVNMKCWKIEILQDGLI